MVLEAIKQTFVNYYDELPENIAPTIAKSAFYTFTASLIIAGASSKEKAFDMTKPLIYAGVAALASFIHALVTPLFNKIFGTRQRDAFHELTKSCIIALLTTALIDYATTSKINLLAFKMFYLISANSCIAWLSFFNNNNGQYIPQPFIRENSIYLCFGFWT